MSSDQFPGFVTNCDFWPRDNGFQSKFAQNDNSASSLTSLLVIEIALKVETKIQARITSCHLETLTVSASHQSALHSTNVILKTIISEKFAFSNVLCIRIQQDEKQRLLLLLLGIINFIMEDFLQRESFCCSLLPKSKLINCLPVPFKSFGSRVATLLQK